MHCQGGLRPVLRRLAEQLRRCGAAALTCWCTSASGCSPSKSGRPVNIVVMTQPSAYKSLRSSEAPSAAPVRGMAHCQ